MTTKLRLLAIMLIAAVIGCSGAATPGSTPSGSIASSPRPIGSTPAPTPSARSTTQPSSPPSATPLPDVAAAPTGAWNRIAWIDAGAVVPLGPRNVSVFGWSRGFVGFARSGGETGEGPITISASSSTDGLRWTPATEPDASGLDGAASIRTVLEGADGLLAVGFESAGTCGGPASVNALWSSADGTAWRRLALPADFRVSRVETLDGGPSGYIATGLRADGATPGIWTSADGAGWRLRPNPKVASGSVVVDDATSFSGGLVVAGAVLGPDGCGGASSLHPSLWWSSDGLGWSREQIDGGSSANDAWMSVVRLSDEVVVAIESSSDQGLEAWVSHDGRAWTRASTPPTQLDWASVGDGRRSVIVADPESGSGPPTVLAIGDDMTVTTLVQSGTGPIAGGDSLGWTSAVGPTGIVVVSDNGRELWLGIPS